MNKISRNRALFSSLLFLSSMSTAAEPPKLAPSTVVVTVAIPEEKILNQCPTGMNTRKIVIMRLTGVKIDEDGFLKLKRNVRLKGPATADPEANLPQATIPNVVPTPFDMKIPKPGPGIKELVQIKIIVRNQVGASFMPDPGNPNLAYVRSGKGQSAFLCGLTETVQVGGRQELTFSILPNSTAGFAVGILVPEVDDEGVATGRKLPLIIDPNVQNEG